MTARRTPLPNLQPVLLGIGFTLLVVISGGTAFLVNRAATDMERLSHTLAVQDKLSNVLLAMRRAGGSERGYLFTGEAEYLKEFSDSEPQARQLVEELRTLTRDNPARQAMLDQLTRMMDIEFKTMGDAIALAQSGRSDEARRLVVSGGGRAVGENLRKTVEAATIDEARLAAEHTQESQRTYRLLLYITLAGATLIVVIGAISVALVQRSAQQRESARAELEATNANLERIVEHRTADLTEANREVQRFAYIVSHDLRSPLVNIMGFTSELEELHKQIFTQFNRLSAEVAAHDAQAASAAVAGAPSAGQLAEDFDEAIRFIKRSIANMDRLINAVLKLSREGRRDFQPERIDMNALIEGIAATMTHRAVELDATIAVGPLPEIETDRLAVEQIFANLIDNGLKYGRDGVPLYIEITGRTDATYAFFDIRDNGRGIAPEDHERVFELFRRAGLPDRQGEGIGLAYVRAQVRRLGGMVDLSSTLGEGSTFTIRLPRQWATGQRSTT